MDYLKELGFNTETPSYRLAKELTEEDYILIESLVKIRKASGLKLKDIAERTGSDEASISRFEHHMRDAHMSTIRAYAHAVGARIRHSVEPVEDIKDGSPASATTRKTPPITSPASDPLWERISQDLSERTTSPDNIEAGKHA